MKFGTQLKKLHKRIKFERKFKTNFTNIIQNKEVVEESKNIRFKKDEKKSQEQLLGFLKKLLELIEDGATGFDLAYEVEKNKEVKKLIYDGILFHSTFIEIGNKKFTDVPDKKKVDYKAFRTIEDTEKFIFLVWLKEKIVSLEKEIKPKEDYNKYIEARKIQEIKNEKIKLREALTHCKNCGERIRSKTQDFCEKCGVNLLENI
ncbi:hypothetical protein LCGC14_1227580 [marine sediment metagenome]|uniref:Zinc-ribbon domain-containing protein n=1 Tax=marine sediment metagenome TaxID=412755 RepID=A0A0F9LDI4_9ZZZZ